MPHPAPQLSERTAAADAALAARLALGDAGALDPLYRRYRGPIYRFSLLWSGSSAIAADVTQDVFVHLLTRATAFDPARGLLLPWLLGIARNFVRKRTGTAQGSADGECDVNDLEDPGAQGGNPEIVVSARRDAESLRRAIAALPPAYRDVLVLVELTERSYAETAAICGLELNTVRSRLFRARQWLARRLETTEHSSPPSAAMRSR